MEKLDLLYEGKAKKVYKTDVEDVLIVDYKDDATAFNGLKKGTIVGKGVINNKMSNHIMRLLEKEGVPTHLVEELSDRETAVKKVQIVPLEVIVRNIAAGSFSKKMGIEAESCFAPHWSSAIRMTRWAIRSSMITMRWHWAWQRRKRSTPLLNTL